MIIFCATTHMISRKPFWIHYPPGITDSLCSVYQQVLTLYQPITFTVMGTTSVPLSFFNSSSYSAESDRLAPLMRKMQAPAVCSSSTDPPALSGRPFFVHFILGLGVPDKLINYLLIHKNLLILWNFPSNSDTQSFITGLWIHHYSSGIRTK